MLRMTFRLSVCCCLALCWATAAERKPEVTELSREVREAFAWYETLGHPKTARLTWVGVHPGYEVEWDNEPPVMVPYRGFLLSDDKHHFTVLGPDLRQSVFKKEVVSLPVRVPAK